jgi:hypothetical protein
MKTRQVASATSMNFAQLFIVSPVMGRFTGSDLIKGQGAFPALEQFPGGW